VDVGRAGRVLDLLVRRLRPGEAEVLADGGVEEVRLLGDDADGGGQRRERQLRTSTPSMDTLPRSTS
jgi:hypothetical protein